jgi:hypothetical protein
LPAVKVVTAALVADPPTSGTGAPTGFPSTWNYTVPVGLAVPESAFTVAVNVRGTTALAGFLLDCSVVVVEMSRKTPKSDPD